MESLRSAADKLQQKVNTLERTKQTVLAEKQKSAEEKIGLELQVSKIDKKITRTLKARTFCTFAYPSAHQAVLAKQKSAEEITASSCV